MSAFYLGTSTHTSSTGAALVEKDRGVRELHLVAQTCPDCGKVAVLFNEKRVAIVDLGSSRRLNKQVLRAVRFTSLRIGDITLEIVSRRKMVRIDGLVIAVR